MKLVRKNSQLEYIVKNADSETEVVHFYYKVHKHWIKKTTQMGSWLVRIPERQFNRLLEHGGLDFKKKQLFVTIYSFSKTLLSTVQGR